MPRAPPYGPRPAKTLRRAGSDESERTRLRLQALGWLRAYLELAIRLQRQRRANGLVPGQLANGLRPGQCA